MSKKKYIRRMVRLLPDQYYAALYMARKEDRELTSMLTRIFVAGLEATCYENSLPLPDDWGESTWYEDEVKGEH